MRKLKSNLAILCVVCLLCGVLSVFLWSAVSNTALAVGVEQTTAQSDPAATPERMAADAALAGTERDEKLAVQLAARSGAPVTRTVAVGMDAKDYTQTATVLLTPVYVDGVFEDYCYVLDGTPWFPVERYCALLGQDCEVTRDGGAEQISVAGIELALTYGETVYTANDRYFYVPDGVRALDGSVVLPAADLEKIFGAAIVYDAADESVRVDTERFAVLESGDSFYAAHDVYWLSRIIYAESNGEPLTGMIGVGNVVLNRVASEQFPDTVQEVVFDARVSIQFSPVSIGTIYLTPSDEAVLAAKLCFEGANTVGESTYFINPAACNSSWFESALTRVTTIGNHVFYV